MVDVSSVALSGFNASEARLTVAANNIANANTPNFRAGAVAQSTNQDGSVSTQFVAANPPPQPAPVTAQSKPQDTNDVDLATNLVNTNFATYSAQADLKVLKTQDQLNKYLFDIQA
jgi:flagellar basal body rod protein FlgB